MVVIKKYHYILYCAILCVALISCKKKSPSKILPAQSIATNPKEVNVTIFVHGTHSLTITKLLKNILNLPQKLTKIESLNSLWYAPVLKQMVKHNPQYFTESSFYVFGWTGELSSKAREDAARILYDSIKELVNIYKVDSCIPKITLITHSHGGNVALNLAKVKDTTDNDFVVDRLVLLACPVQEATKNYIPNKIFKRVYNIYSKIDMMQILDPQGIHEENKSNPNCPWFSDRKFKACENLKQTKIKVNDRAVMHDEFIHKRFLNILPQLLLQMDNIDSRDTEYLIKIRPKVCAFQILDMQNYVGKLKRSRIKKHKN